MLYEELFQKKMSIVTPVLLGAAAVGSICVSQYIFGLFFQFLGLVLFAAFFATYLQFYFDHVIPKVNDAIKKNNEAQVWSIVCVSNAVRGLSQLQTETVNKYDMAGVMVWAFDTPGERLAGYVQLYDKSMVPWEAVEEFIVASVDTAPYLLPERDALARKFLYLNKDIATSITETFVVKGWATRGGGPRSARLCIPIEVLAKKYEVEL